MKKAILMTAITLSLVACKKGEKVETTNEISTENVTVADSASANPVAENEISTKKIYDSTGKIEVLENEKKQKLENFEKILPKIDSAEMKLETPKIVNEPKKDSANKVSPQTVKVVVTPEKIIREKKVIYKDSPSKKNYDEGQKTSAYLEITSTNYRNTMENIRDLSAYYDAKIKSESEDITDETRVSDLVIVLPAKSVSQFMYNAETYGEMISRRNIINHDSKLAEIHLVINSTIKPTDNQENRNGFGSEVLGAIGDGGSALGKILLFLLPFWPVFLGGIGAYFYFKRKKKNSANGNNP